MPKLQPDRDDQQGNMSGQGGPQTGSIGQGSDQRQSDENDLSGLGAGATMGSGGQRNQNGSSRDSESRH